MSVSAAGDETANLDPSVAIAPLTALGTVDRAEATGF